MPSDIVALPAAEALKQPLNAMVATAEPSKEKATALHRRVLVVRQLLDEEQAAVVDLERQSAATKKLVLGSTSSSTTEPAANSSSYEDTVVANLHIQAAAVPNVRSLVNIVLDDTSDNYARWCDNVLLALTRYALTDHVESDDAFPDILGWTRMDVVILYWLTNMISPDLMEVVQEHGRTTRHLWLGLQNQFLGNRETHTLHLDAAFCKFLQGNLSVSEYCCKFKGMADALADLGPPVDDRILVLNFLRGLNQCFEHVGAIIRRYSSFLNFLKVRDDLLLEEIHLDTSGPAAAITEFYSNNTPPAPLPPPVAPRPPNKTNGSGPDNGNDSNNNRTKNNNRHNGGNGGKNSDNGRNRGGNTTTASNDTTTNDDRGPPPWPTYVNL
jgi:hypothetical protein